MTAHLDQSDRSIQRIEELMSAGGCDLHLHTYCSDGSDSPAGLVTRVRQVGLRAFAITDHDTLSAIRPAQEALDALSAEVDESDIPVLVPGVELSVDDGRELHLLGYFPFGGETALETFLAEQRERREARNQRMLDHLAGLGYPIPSQEFHESGEEVLGRMQVALLLVKGGYFKTVSEVFDQLLGDGKPGYLERPRPSIAEAIRVIRAAGGAAVLAHPANYGWCGEGSRIQPELIDRLLRYRAFGLQGVEAFHGEAPEDAHRQIESAARIAGLAVTAGSDDHGAHKKHARLFRGDQRFGMRPPTVVTAALIEGMTQDGEFGLLFARRAGKRSMCGLWEFPGGKVESGESPEACLARELAEELQVEAAVGPLVLAFHHDYGAFCIVLMCYQTVISGAPVLDPEVHDASVIVTLNQARQMDLLGADYGVLDFLDQQGGLPLGNRLNGVE